MKHSTGVLLTAALFSTLAWAQPPAQSTDNSNTSSQQTTQDQQKKKKLKPEDDVSLIGNRKVGQGINFYSLQKEIALGRQLADEVSRSSHIIDDPVVNEYINRLAQNLVRNSDAKVPFTVKVIQDDTLNAFALPGGFFFVNSGLITACDEEDELAGAMAHEIAHVAARHATRNATKGELMQMATIPVVIAAGPGLGGLAAQNVAGLAIPLKYMSFSRAAEREADWLGIQYMYKTGYDPEGLVRSFEKIEALEKKKPGLISRAFASHPQTPDRVENSQREIAEILPPRQEYIVTTSDFSRVKARLAALLKKQAVPNAQSPTSIATAQTVPSTSGKQGGASDDEKPPVLKRPNQ
jgi:predicted Zn-dependent protease